MATTISIALPPNHSPTSPPPYTSVLKRPRSVSLSSIRTNPAFMTWLSILLLRVHQNALVAGWLSTWQWLGLPSTSASVSGGSYETAWLRGWVAARQHYVMTCWDAVWYHILHPTATFKLPNLEKKKRKLSLPPPPSSTSSPASSDSEVPDSEKLDTRSHEASTTTTTTLSEKYLSESPESTVTADVDSSALTTSPPIIEVRLPPRTTSSSVFEEACLRNVQVEGDAGIIKTEIEDIDVSTAGDCSPVCDSGYASDEQEDVTAKELEAASEALTFIDSPVIRKHNSSFSYFEVTSTSSSCETVPLPLTDEFDDDDDDDTVYPTHFHGLPIPLLTLTPSPDEPFPEYVPIQLSYHGTYLSVPAKPCYESLVHARRALRCTIVGWWGEMPESDDEHDAELEADLEELGSEEMCVEDMVYWLEDDEEELPDLPNDW